MNNETQYVCLNMDDSGKLSQNEDYLVYAGIVFLSNKERTKFANFYKSILKDIRCHHCKENETNCSNSCPEIKSFNISNSERRRFMNLAKKYTTFGVVITNRNVRSHIMENAASKGRYIDYAQKMLIKAVIKNLIANKIIDPKKPISIIVNIDQQTTKSNGYYNLRDSIYEELVHGIINYNYYTYHEPILFGKTDVSVYYLDSAKAYPIQMADIIAGTLRHTMIETKSIRKTSDVVDIFKDLP